MNATRKGKLARLPNIVRERLNERLANGEPFQRLAHWLNTLPEVQAIVASEFGGVPVSEQNVCRWKHGGYRDWQSREETRSLAERLVAESRAAGHEEHPPLSETLTEWVAARYIVATQRLANADDDTEAWRLLRQMCADVVQLHRREQAAKRLELDRQKTTRSKPGPSYTPIPSSRPSV